MDDTDASSHQKNPVEPDFSKLLEKQNTSLMHICRYAPERLIYHLILRRLIDEAKTKIMFLEP